MNPQNLNLNITALHHAAKLLAAGKLVAIPTETVYGLAADARNPTAIEKIFRVKQRPLTNPLIIHLPRASAINAWAQEIPQNAWNLAEAFWPGPLTLVLKRHPNVDKLLTGGQETVALRVPNHPLTLALLEIFDGPLCAPSANHYGRISPTQAAHVAEEFKDQIDYILDGGACSIGIESTIVFVEDEKSIRILRPGHISERDILSVLGPVLIQDKDNQDNAATREIRSPGSSLSHYAPEKPLYLVDANTLQENLNLLSKTETVGVLSFLEKPKHLSALQDLIWIQAENDAARYATSLYHDLRMLDKSEATCIVVEDPGESLNWMGVKDRLKRAATSLPKNIPLPDKA